MRNWVQNPEARSTDTPLTLLKNGGSSVDKMDCNMRALHLPTTLIDAADNASACNGLTSSMTGSGASFPIMPFQGAAGVGVEKRKKAAGAATNAMKAEAWEEYSEWGRDAKKKRRLTLEQVKALEKSFESANRVQPDKKRQLARALGLEPRQVAVWFQNRRARFKSRQLLKSFNSLKSEFDSLNLSYHNLLQETNHLRAIIKRLSRRLRSLYPEKGELKEGIAVEGEGANLLKKKKEDEHADASANDRERNCGMSLESPLTATLDIDIGIAIESNSSFACNCVDITATPDTEEQTLSQPALASVGEQRFYTSTNTYSNTCISDCNGIRAVVAASQWSRTEHDALSLWWEYWPPPPAL